MKQPASLHAVVAYIQPFLVEADTTRIRCVDDRPSRSRTTGIQIQGGTSGIVDALKVVLGLPEDEAWRLSQEKGMPMGAHDDEHRGPNGCGYNHLVETSPSSVGAVASATAASRLARVPAEHVLHCLGDHSPVHAAINYRFGTTLDTDRIFTDGTGVFSLDAWALTDLATTAGLSYTEGMRFVDHILDAYHRTVIALAGPAIQGLVYLC